MKQISILIVLLTIAGCVTLNKGDRKREAVVIESSEVRVKPILHIPQIRKPRIVKQKRQAVPEQTEETADMEVVELKGFSAPVESNENLSEVERNKRFDNLIKDEQIKEDNPSRLDTATLWIGAIGVCAVFWAGVYYVARNLF